MPEEECPESGTTGPDGYIYKSWCLCALLSCWWGQGQEASEIARCRAGIHGFLVEARCIMVHHTTRPLYHPLEYTLLTPSNPLVPF